jgi:hypothetical protein
MRYARPRHVSLQGTVNTVTHYPPLHSTAPTRDVAHAHALVEDAQRARGRQFTMQLRLAGRRRPAGPVLDKLDQPGAALVQPHTTEA